MPKDPKRSFKLRLLSMMKKSCEIANTGAQIAIYIEREDERVIFKTHDDLVPEWNNHGTVYFTPANLPAEPDFEESRQYITDIRASPVDGSTITAAVSPSLDISLSSPPYLHEFSTLDLDDIQPDNTVSARPVLLQMNAGLTSSPPLTSNKRRRSAMTLVRKPPTLQRSKRARTAAWFE